MTKARVLVLLLEGDSDRFTFETGFSLLLNDLDPAGILQVLVFRGDVTINDRFDRPIDSNEVIDNVVSFINAELRNVGLRSDDVVGVVHITDLDAVFASDESVVYADSWRPYYDIERQCFYTCNVEATHRRNATKRDSLLQLMQTTRLELSRSCLVPYRLFYVGVNLEHVFYGEANCTKAQKEEYGFAFDGNHAGSRDAFLRFLSTLPHQGETYEESLRFARDSRYAFDRMSNLGFVLDFLESLFPR